MIRHPVFAPMLGFVLAVDLAGSVLAEEALPGPDAASPPSAAAETPASPTPASQEPASPTPASPAPASQEPASQEAAETSPSTTSGSAPNPSLVWLRTGSLAGVYFPVGVALCRLPNQHRAETGLRCTAVPSTGSVENVEALRDGAADLALAQSDTGAAALAGTGAFQDKGAFGDLRAIMSLYPEPVTILARADAGIATLADLSGKRVALGQAGSGQRVLAEALVAALGWTDASFAATPDLPPEDLADALCGGQIDAFLIAIGHPALVAQEATRGCDARLVPVTGPAVDALVAASPALVTAEIPGGLYRGNPRPTPTFGPIATLFARAEAPDVEIRAVVAGIFGDFDMLTGLNPALGNLDRSRAATAGLVAPLHPAAEGYYREQGLRP